MSGRDILAFIHVEKAAGTTLIHILRYNFFLGHLDVRPYTIGAGGTFGPRDLAVALRVNPALRCIAGHSIKAFSGLETSGCRLRYITVLREPIKRYLSQFQYSIERRGQQITFEQFLRNDWFTNFQTKKFSATGDVEEAKRVLAEKMLLVGTSDRFDEFLLMLRRKLMPMQFDPAYQERNVGRNTVPLSELLDRHAEQIYEQNRLDIELYRFATEDLRLRFVQEFGPGLDAEVESFKAANEGRRPLRLRPYVDYLYRRAYAMPLTGLIRMSNGLPATGAY